MSGRVDEPPASTPHQKLNQNLKWERASSRSHFFRSIADSCLGINSWKKKSESREWQDYQEIAVFPFPVFNPDLQEKLILLLAEEFTAEDCNTRWNEVLIFLQS